MRILVSGALALIVAYVTVLSLLVAAWSENVLVFWAILAALALAGLTLGFRRVLGMSTPGWLIGLAAGGALGAGGLFAVGVYIVLVA